MEINLKFNEKEYKAICEASYKALLSSLSDDLERRRSAGKVLIGLSVFFFSLSFYNWSWLYIFGLFGVITLLYFYRTESKKHKVVLQIKKSREEANEFILKMQSIQEVKYKLNEEAIHYHENGKLTDTFKWTRVKSYAKDVSIIVLNFRKPTQMILIPRSMTSLKEFEAFEKFVKRKLKELNFEFT